MSNRSTGGFLSEAFVNFPLASIRVDEGGVMRVTHDGRDFPPLRAGFEWSRAQFGELLDALSDHRTRTIRVEVREHDGSIFTDIIHATRHEHTDVDSPAPGATRRARHRPMRQLFEVRGSGFVPGEDVAVALSISGAEGSANGTARAVIDLSQLVDHRSEVVLIGRVSGVIISEFVSS
ncbi:MULTISPECIES: hypothetical protein [Microbacterium]|uniref:hypothetical protein n=1 Tax=Microbacterium TaxID=33882 RepID=UPI00141EEAB9|nr:MULTISPECIES: hypothetical protein [Microbacterium]NIG66303.1 hypothetical protein [Microbacterium sp. Be9]